MARSYFTILGISLDADAEEVKNAYRRLAKRYHPDREGGDSRKFQEVQEAYTVLIDPEERRRHRSRSRSQSSGGNVPVRVVRSEDRRRPHRERVRAEPLRPEREGSGGRAAEHIAPGWRRQRSTSADISGRPGRRSRFDSLSEIEELFDRLFRDFF